jgi:hypothetical protein
LLRHRVVNGVRGIVLSLSRPGADVLSFYFLLVTPCDVAEVPDLSASRDNSDLAEDDPCDPTTTSKPEAPMQSLNQLPVVTDLADARSA